ncbi:hypothetical protein PY365_26210 [Roseiarcaceae bacterium H3SJ34-1]|uniref:hypothetical protein n=1 Tax=Terripilifer ovatus TaxID=3032367 RepID=UPI003AB9B5B3|nr:hypothetical protein [Roseiarcaceae bacterium H3SJ34-1]
MQPLAVTVNKDSNFDSKNRSKRITGFAIDATISRRVATSIGRKAGGHVQCETASKIQHRVSRSSPFHRLKLSLTMLSGLAGSPGIVKSPARRTAIRAAIGSRGERALRPELPTRKLFSHPIADQLSTELSSAGNHPEAGQRRNSPLDDSCRPRPAMR